jgi:hypothetical protein
MLSVRVKPIRRELEILIDRNLSPKARAAILARYARKALAEGLAINTRVLGTAPPFETFVDGVEGGSEDQVKAEGRIVYQFELGFRILAAILTELQRISPVRGGRYVNSHELFADGVMVDNPSDPPAAKEYVFMNMTIYSRKIEGTEHSGGRRPPQSRQAPSGVYNVVAQQMQRQFGNIANIRFSYRAAFSGLLGAGRAGNASENRVPAIVVSLR